MDNVKYWYIFGIHLFLMTQGEAAARYTEDRWLVKPERHIKVILGRTMVFHYKYANPPGSPKEGKLYFAHHIPEDQHENILIEANIGIDTGHLRVIYEMFPGKVIMTSDIQQVWFQVTNMTLDDGGRYLTDVHFDTDAALNDAVQVSVFERPRIERIHPQVMLQSMGNYTTFAWNLEERSRKQLPEVTSISISHRRNGGNWTRFISHEKRKENEQWQLTHPDKNGRFCDRISYAPGPKSERVQLTLWDIRPNDIGQYKIHVGYEDDVITLEDITTLHFNPGLSWLSTPNKNTLIIESRPFRFNFILDMGNSTFEKKTFQLIRTGRNPESLCTSLNIDQNGLLSTVVGNPCIDRWNVVLEKQILTFFIKRVSMDDEGFYRAILKDSENIVLQYDFRVEVKKDELLTPVITTNMSKSNGAAYLEVKIKDGLPKANISLYSVQNNVVRELLQQSNETCFLHSQLTTSKENVILVRVDYIGLCASYEDFHKIQVLNHENKSSEQQKEHLCENEQYHTTTFSVLLSAVFSGIFFFILFAIMQLCTQRKMKEQLKELRLTNTSLADISLETKSILNEKQDCASNLPP